MTANGSAAGRSAEGGRLQMGLARGRLGAVGAATSVLLSRRMYGAGGGVLLALQGRVVVVDASAA
jgi:hypothetical protein